MTAKEFREQVDERHPRRRLLFVDTNAKTVKGQKRGYMTGIMYLAPSDECGRGNVCPFASKGCKAACLYTAGHGRFDRTKNSRIGRTRLWFDNKDAFMHNLILDIISLTEKAEAANMTPCVRLNGTSDIPWESIYYKGKTVFEWFPDIQHYDYTKTPTRFRKKLPDNYHLTFSRSESNDSHIAKVLKLAPETNIAVVFDKQLPETFMDRPVVDADLDDLRFLDTPGSICGLRAKGDGKKDKTGFVVSYKLQDLIPLGKR